MNSTIYANSPLMLKNFIELNGIKGAFIVKEDGLYKVYEGDPETECGFVAGECKLKRDAVALKNRINELISTVA